jgi:hypothetical protein
MTKNNTISVRFDDSLIKELSDLNYILETNISTIFLEEYIYCGENLFYDKGKKKIKDIEYIFKKLNFETF